MWERLDDEYGDVAVVTDSIIDEITRFKPLKDGENLRFVEFVDVVESGYRDLKRLHMEREITTTSSVSIIEKRLPPKVRGKWSERVVSREAKVDKTNKFPYLLEFLLEKKRAIRYDSADLRSTPGRNVKYSSAYENIANPKSI
jgi:hypothetical protein